MEDREYKKFLIIVMTIILLILSFLIIKPIIISVLLGMILAYIFSPLYRKVEKLIKSETLSAFIIVAGIIIIIFLPVILFMPLIIRQAVSIYLTMQSFNIEEVLKQIFPKIFESLSQSADFIAITSSFSSHIAKFFVSLFEKIIFNLPSFLLQTAIILFTFFFMLRDSKKMKEYVLSISPLSKEVQEKFYNKFKQITNSLLYGQLIVGISQGLVAGIGYFIFGVPNAPLFTFLTVLASIIPIIGPWIVWVPVDIYLFLSGNTNSGMFLLIYGLVIVSWIDNFLRPFIVSRMTKMNSAIVLIGMVGGLYVFGITGLIFGPLILAYLLLIIEFYKEGRLKSILIEEAPAKTFPIS